METPCVYDMNVLYDAFVAAMKSSPWKEEPQRFETDFLSNLVALHHELQDRTYHTLPGSEFILNERGKIRHVHGGRMRDRVVRHALCDAVLTPALRPYILHNNFASQTGKGVDAARRAFERDLHNYWLEHRTNEGYAAFLDFSKYYDNIRHRRAKDMVCEKLDDEDARWLFCEIVDNFAVDVSYMTDEEFARCLDEKFNSVAYYETVTPEMKTGEKFMEKSVDIGDQVSQNIGVYYPTGIDNYITNVCGIRRYGRYMDDLYIIHPDREYLVQIAQNITELARERGLFINERKTRIVKLGGTYVFLKIKYSLTETGKVIRRLSPSAVTRERRRLKAYRRLLDKGQITYATIEQAYKSWMGRYARLMSKQQRINMQTQYQNLFDGRNPRWKPQLIPSSSPTAPSSSASA